MVVCADDAKIASKSDKDIENLLHSLKNGMDEDTKKERLELKKFDFADDSNIKFFLGMSFEQTSSGLLLPQYHLISRILEAVGLTVEDNFGRNTKDPLQRNLS